MSKKLGTLIKAARVAAGLTQIQLAKKIKGVTQADIGRYERGEAVPTKTVVKEIAKVCGVTQKSLLDAMPATTSKKPASGKTGKTSSSKKPASSTSTAAKNTMRVTATEKRLVELYREADSDTKKKVLAMLRGKDLYDNLGIDDIIGGLIGAAFGQK